MDHRLFPLALLIIACSAPRAPRVRERTAPVRVTLAAKAKPAAPNPEPPSIPAPSEPGPVALARRMPLRVQRVIGRSRRGRSLRLTVLGDGPVAVLFLASIHGSEPAGTPLLERFEEYLLARPELLAERRALILARVNPDGLARGGRRGRFNARGIDLNRNFPAANFQGRRGGATALSEPESQALFDLIEEEKPARFISIHQPLSCVDYDGPGRALAKAMSEACGLRLHKLGGRPGSLGSYVGEDLKRPIVTLELPRGAEAMEGDALWDRYGAALLVALAGLEPSSERVSSATGSEAR